MTPAYAREMAAARRDADALGRLLLGNPNADLTTIQLMAAIGLATTARDALLRAAQTRADSGPPNREAPR